MLRFTRRTDAFVAPPARLDEGEDEELTGFVVTNPCDITKGRFPH